MSDHKYLVFIELNNYVKEFITTYKLTKNFPKNDNYHKTNGMNAIIQIFQGWEHASKPN
jgi:hypothetical protein